MKVRRSSLNYRLWKAWREDEEPKNLFSYFCQSAFNWTLGLIIMAVVGIIAVVIIGLIIATIWFSGYRVIFDKGDPGLFRKYKQDLYNWTARGRRYKIAPWEAAVPICSLSLIYVLAKLILKSSLLALAGTGTIVVLAGIIFALVKLSKTEIELVD